MGRINYPMLMVSIGSVPHTDGSAVYPDPPKGEAPTIPTRRAPCGGGAAAPAPLPPDYHDTIAGMPYGAYPCSCGRYVEVSTICEDEGISMLRCPGCEFRTFIDMRSGPALTIFAHGQYTLPHDFLAKHEI